MRFVDSSNQYIPFTQPKQFELRVDLDGGCQAAGGAGGRVPAGVVTALVHPADIGLVSQPRVHAEPARGLGVSRPPGLRHRVGSAGPVVELSMNLREVSQCPIKAYLLLMLVCKIITDWQFG